MWVASNDVEEVIDWFFRHSKAHFLGLFVAGDPKFGKFLKDVLSQRQTIDIISGHAIDLVLFSPEPIGEDPIFGSSIQHIGNLKKWTPSFSGKVADATAMSTNDIATALRLQIDDLPGLVLMRRRAPGDDYNANRLVLRLRGAHDVEFIIAFLREFRRSVERYSLEQARSIRKSESRLIDIEHRLSRLPAEQLVIDKRIRLLQRFSGELATALDLQPQTGDFLFALLRDAETEPDIWQGIAEISGTSIDDVREKIPARLIARANTARLARKNAIANIEKLEDGLEDSFAYVGLLEEEAIGLERILRSYERKITIETSWQKFLDFLKISEGVLGRAKRLAKLIVAFKMIV